MFDEQRARGMIKELRSLRNRITEIVKVEELGYDHLGAVGSPASLDVTVITTRNLVDSLAETVMVMAETLIEFLQDQQAERELGLEE